MLSSPHTLPQSDGCIRLCSAAPTNILNVRTLREQGSGSLSDPYVCSLQVGPNLVPRCFHFEDEGVFHMTSQCFLREGRGKNNQPLLGGIHFISTHIALSKPSKMARLATCRAKVYHPLQRSKHSEQQDGQPKAGSMIKTVGSLRLPK